MTFFHHPYCYFTLLHLFSSIFVSLLPPKLKPSGFFAPIAIPLSIVPPPARSWAKKDKQT